MKINKKLFISLLAGILTTTSLAVTTTNIDQAQTTTSNVNSEQGKLTLNHKTRVYNKKGKKKYSYLKTNGLLKKGALVRYVGKIKALSDPNTKRYSFSDEDMNWYYLPYKTIKGKQYYNIGHGGYIKAVNVDSINGNRLVTNYVTVTIASWPFSSDKDFTKARLVNNKGEFTDKYVKKGTKLVVDRFSNREELAGTNKIDMLDNGVVLEVYRIKNNKNLFVLRDDLKTPPRQSLIPYTNIMTVKFVNDAYLYNTKGELGDESRFRPGDTVSVTSLRYIWVPEDKKAELFYEVLDSPSSVLNCNFVKVSTAKYIFGKHLKPVNTAADVTSANTEKDVKE